ncbi:Hsp20/alpha crystallin family protein [Hydrotalea sp.]|uniref:Hsp20/alpha crystallin family protein n=1 Tax=Hydrotalea sp. TaxID=2881279 RepID=UPI002611AE2D|nr:Hsp20/alpha crystallin family protein [Hydrotalea sp.]
MQYNTQHGFINRNPYRNTFREKSNYFMVPVNIYKTPTAFEIELMAAGRKKENFQIKTDNGLLTIEYQPTAPVENHSKKWIQQDFADQAFKKVFSLTDHVLTDNIQASYQDGILKIYLPFKAEKMPLTKTIAVA